MKPPKLKAPREVDYFMAELITNDFIDNEMPHLKPAEIKLALVIRRKTIGWGKWSEEIGAIELCKRTALDKDTVKRTVAPLCKKLGIAVKQSPGFRRWFTWPLNERVAAALAEARKDWGEGGKLPPITRGSIVPKGGGQTTPEGGGSNPPTQCNTYKSPKERTTMKPDMLQLVNFGDLSLYVGRIRQLYDKLINHGHREMEGASPGDPLPFSYSEFESLVNAALAVGSCYHCRGRLNKSNCSPDHMQALSVGGTSDISNIRIICKDCNNDKGHMPDDEFHRKMFSIRLANLRKASQKV